MFRKDERPLPTDKGEGRRESSWDQKGKGKAPQDHPEPKRKSPTTKPGPKGKGKRATSRI